MTRWSTATRLIDRATIVVAVAVVVVLLGRRIRRHDLAQDAVPLHAPGSADGGAVMDSSMVFPSGRRLSRLELHDLSQSGVAEGDSAPVVRIVMFVDFGCGWCATFDSTVKLVMAKYPDLVGVVIKPLVLDTLRTAAIDVPAAAYCAREFGKFAEFQHAAYANQGFIDDRDGWQRIGRVAGIADDATFERCVLSDLYRARVLNNGREARSLGFRSTPASIIGRRPVVGNLSFRVLDSLVVLAVADVRNIRR